MIGRVKWFNNEKGYGFIEYKENEYAFTEKDMYFVDCTTGEIIGGDSMK